jgi:hypothetical protein
LPERARFYQVLLRLAKFYLGRRLGESYRTNLQV